MKAELGSSAEKETRFLLLFSLLAFVEFLAAGFIILNIERDPKNAALFGFSILRVLLFLITLGLGGLILAGGLVAYRRRLTLDWFSALREEHTRSAQLRLHAIVGLLALLILWGWVSLFASSYLFGRGMYFFERVRPLSVALGLAAFQVILFGWLARCRPAPLHTLLKDQRTLILSTVLFLALIIGLWLLISTTGLGLTPDKLFWNVPGMPLSGPQFFGLLLLAAGGVFLVPLHRSAFPIFNHRRVDLALFLGLYLLTLVVWAGTPMRKHADSIEPAAPNYQPYPYSDARVHDAGGLAVLKGYGINFRGYTDKPLYMVFLGLLHLVSGQDYHLLTLLQVAFMAWIPAVLYLLGWVFHSRALGLFTALAIVLRQGNGIDLAYIIDSTNPKLFLTEVPVMLGLVLLSLCLFLWLKDPRSKGWLALLSGGVLGICTLIRLNPLLLFPAVIGLSLFAMWRAFGNWLRHAALFTLGLAILVVPWMFAGVNENGLPWLYIKFLDVIQVRYEERSALPILPPMPPVERGMYNPSLTQPGVSLSESQGSGGKLARVVPVPQLTGQPQIGPIDDLTRFPYFIINHFLHNLVSSVLALPDSLQYEDLKHLSQREYWQYGNHWQGELPPVQAGLIGLNLILISAGLGYSWARHRWAGLVPLMVCLVYALSLGLARNSGTRYIIPIDWVLFFYQGLGILLALTFIRSVFAGSKSQDAPVMAASASSAAGLVNSPRFAMPVVLVALILVASLVPLANLAIPRQNSLVTNTQEQRRLATQLVPESVLATSQLVAGEVLYPYLDEDGALTFDVLTHKGLQNVVVDPAGLKQDLAAGQTVLVGLQSEAGSGQPNFILTDAGAQPAVVWAR